MGQYVDREDLLLEFSRLLDKKVADLEAEQASVTQMSPQKVKMLRACRKKQEKLKQQDQVRRKTVDQMQALFQARLLKPQRLINLSIEEEE